MKKWKIALLAIVVIGVAGAGYFFIFVPREPVHDGRRLSFWLEKLCADEVSDAERVAVHQAVAAFGQEAAPWLIWTARKNNPNATIIKRSLAVEARKESRQLAALFALNAIRPKANADYRALVSELTGELLGPARASMGTAATPYLLDLMSHHSATVRESALGALRTADFTKSGLLCEPEPELVPKVVGAYLKSIDDPSLEVRRGAALWLSFSCFPPLVGPRPARDQYWEQADGVLLKRKMMEKLTAALDDSDANIRSSAIRGLGRCGADAESAVPKLVEVLKSNAGDDFTVQSIAGSLREIGCASEVVVPAMRELLTAQNSRIRASALVTLAFFGVKDQVVVNELISQLQPGSDSKLDPWKILRSLREIGEPAVDQAWPTLVPRLAMTIPTGSPSSMNKPFRTFERLWKCKVPQLIEALADPSPEVRLFAVLALPIDDERTKPALRRLWTNPAVDEAREPQVEGAKNGRRVVSTSAILRLRQVKEAAMAKLEEIERRAPGPVLQTAAPTAEADR